MWVDYRSAPPARTSRPCKRDSCEECVPLKRGTGTNPTVVTDRTRATSWWICGTDSRDQSLFHERSARKRTPTIIDGATPPPPPPFPESMRYLQPRDMKEADRGPLPDVPLKATTWSSQLDRSWKKPTAVTQDVPTKSHDLANTTQQDQKIEVVYDRVNTALDWCSRGVSACWIVEADTQSGTKWTAEIQKMIDLETRNQP